MDSIIIEDLKVYAHHGVFDFEKQEGQYFYISAVLYTDFSVAGILDDLGETTDYGEVCRFIDRFVRDNNYNLIETLAEQLAQAVLKEFTAVSEIDLEIKKPNAPVELPFENISVRVNRKWHRVFLGIGSNMGDKRAYLESSVSAVQESGRCRLVKVSDFIVTEPVGIVEQDDFLNGCIEIQTTFTPYQLLDFIHGIEDKAKRVREVHWGPRTLDIDILLYDDLIMSDNDLVIPHPEMHKREFVLRPLSQIAPYAFHPVKGMRIQDMAEEFK